MVSEEIILQRDKIECLVRELANAIKHESVYQVKIRFVDDKIVIIPHCSALEITR